MNDWAHITSVSLYGLNFVTNFIHYPCVLSTVFTSQLLHTMNNQEAFIA